MATKKRRKVGRGGGKKHAVNHSGVSFHEWYQSANAFGLKIRPPDAMRAWRKDEDPSEYAAGPTLARKK